MARGMVVGEQVVSQANTEKFREGYDRVFGERKAVRGHWVWDKRQGKLVDAADYVPEPEAAYAPIISGRIHEGMKAPDGTDISTPAKRRAWQKATGIADYDDFRSAREQKDKEQAAKARGEYKPDPELRQIIGRELYKQKVIL